jgi:hypothetical protein
MHPQSGQQFFVYKYIFVYIYKKWKCLLAINKTGS